MSRWSMIRWSYVTPRLTLFAVVVLVVWLVTDPLLRWSLILTGESLTSAKVEIGRLKTSLLHGSVCLNEVQVADPQSPMKNLFEAREIALSLEPGPLARRKFIVRDGRITGLQLGTARATSGALDPQEFPGLSLPGGKLTALAAKELDKAADALLDQLAAMLCREAAKQVEQLQTVRTVKELMDRWPRRYEQLESRADDLRKRIEMLRTELQTTANDLPRQADLPRQLETCRRATVELEQIDRDLRQLRAELEQMPQQALRDRQAIAAAAQQDFDHLQQTFRLSNLNAENLSEYLLGHELGETVVKAAEWIAWARQYMPVQATSPRPLRGRGADIVFPRPQQPDFLVRSLALEGEGQLGQQRFHFLATLAGLTTQPKLYGRPAVLKADIQGAMPMQLEVVADQAGEQPFQRITVDCPGLPQPQRLLGRADQFAVMVSPGNTHLSATIELRGDAISGRIAIRQEPVQLTPQVAAACGGPTLAASVQAALSRIRSVDAAIDLSGTLQKPAWQLRSNVGEQLAAALGTAIQRDLERRRNELAAAAKQHIDGQFATFDRLIMGKQDAVFAKLRLGGDEIQQLSQGVAQRAGVPQQLLGRELPSGLPFRF